jgi:hypothetical protein
LYMPRRVIRTCDCCTLKFPAMDRADMYNVTGENAPRNLKRLLCTECLYHQGESTEQQLKRYKDHEPKLLEARDAAAAWAEKAERKIADSREQVASALRSRELALQMLREVQDIHTMRPDGGCTCGIKKDCRTANVLFNRRIQPLLRIAPRSF